VVVDVVTDAERGCEDLGSEARARIGIAGLLVVTLLSFSQVFAPGDYPGPALLGMLAAAGIAIGARRIGLGTGTTILVSAGALVFYLAFIFHNPHTFFGLPTVTAVERIIDSVSHSLERAQVDFAPVPVRTGYVIMLVVGLWAATTLAEIATFRWKRPLVASMPVVALFAVVMVVGTGRAAPLLVPIFLAMLLTYWGLESSHRLRSWGRWVPTWPGRTEDDEPASVTGNIARRMGAMCVVTALVAPVFLPAIGNGLLAWRTGDAVGGPGGSGGGGGRIDHLVSIAPTLLEQSNTELFVVLTDNPGYWRLVTLARFDGEEWRATDNPTERTDGDGVIEDSAERLGSDDLLGDEKLTSFTIENLLGGNLPSTARAVKVEVGDRQESLRYGSESGDLRLVGGLNPSVNYRVTSAARDLSYSELRDAEPGGDDQVDTIYFELPQPLSPGVVDFRDTAIADAEAETPYEQLVAIQARLRSTEFIYSVEPGADAKDQLASTDYLTQFLTETKTGFCQQFATAFAVLARSLGYPTRVVVGFLPGEATERGRYLVRGTDAHAWPEVYFEEYGWIAFEPTPRSTDQTGLGRIASIPVYTLPGGGSGGFNPEGARNLPGQSGGAGGESGRGAALGSFFAAEDAFVRGEGGFGLSSEDRANPREGELNGNAAVRDPAWAGTFKRVFVVVAFLTVLFLAATPALKEWGIRRAYAQARTPRDLAVAAFREFLINAGELASAKGPAESARAYARRLSDSAELPLRTVLRLAAIYEASEYAREELGDELASEARKLAREMRGRLWGSAPWWNRLLRLFSPGGLRSTGGLRPALGALPFVRSQ
jgi:TgpA N-terminal domain/Transglutaminase-like superfamily